MGWFRVPDPELTISFVVKESNGKANRLLLQRSACVAAGVHLMNN